MMDMEELIAPSGHEPRYDERTMALIKYDFETGLVAFDLLAEARRYGIRLTPTPTGTIKASASAPPPAEFLAKLKTHRDELVTALTDPVFGQFACLLLQPKDLEKPKDG